MTRLIRALALLSAALLLLVVGAALRPLLIPEQRAPRPVLGAIEVGFVQDMSAHHQQALAMAASLAPDVDPTVLALARQIGDAQRVEVGTLLGWLRLAEAVPTNPSPMSWMADRGAGHGHGTDVGQGSAGGAAAGPMPGMASAAELGALAAARGPAAETVFLQLMERHHRGGVAMARAADGLLTGGPVKEVARGMMQSQSREAGLMGVLLARRGIEPLP